MPNVVGSAFECAESTLQGVGFAVAREDVEDAAAAGIVVGQTPAAGTAAEQGLDDHAPGLRGPGNLAGPGRHEPGRGRRPRQLQAPASTSQVVEEIVDDETLDGRVLSQDPEGGTDAEEGTTVVIVVGRFAGAAAEPTPTEPRRP